MDRLGGLAFAVSWDLDHWLLDGVCTFGGSRCNFCREAYQAQVGGGAAGNQSGPLKPKRFEGRARLPGLAFPLVSCLIDGNLLYLLQW